MSEKSRARHLQRVFNEPYQKCLQLVRKNWEAAKALAHAEEIPYREADVILAEREGLTKAEEPTT